MPFWVSHAGRYKNQVGRLPPLSSQFPHELRRRPFPQSSSGYLTVKKNGRETSVSEVDMVIDSRSCLLFFFFTLFFILFYFFRHCRSIAGLLALPLAAAFSIVPLISPDGSIPVSGQLANCTWSAGSTDPQTFSLQLVNSMFHDTYAIASDVESALQSMQITLPLVPTE